MKKIVMTIVAIAMFSSYSFAGEKEAPQNLWEGKINVEKLSNYLDLNGLQNQEVYSICDFFTEKMSEAATTSNDRTSKLRYAIYSNLKLMRQTLTSEQYYKYLTVMNITLNNKGICLE